MPRTSKLDRTRPGAVKRGAGAALAKNPVAKGVRSAMDTSTYEAAALISPDKPLTEQQAAFARLWAKGETISNASLKAGYSDDGIGYRLIRMPNVRRVYDREKALYEQASQMTRQKVMDGLLEGVAMGKLMSEPMAVIAGWREIGRMCGYYEPVKHTLDVTVKGDVTVRQLNGMSDAELVKLISAPGPMNAPDLSPAPLLERVDGDEVIDHERESRIQGL